MSQRKENFVPGEFYHLYNRGTDKRKIFLDKKDYLHFIFLMYICNSTKSIELRNVNKNFDRENTLIDIGAYCLMPNHFHILAREKEENGISKYILKLMTAYTMYFNKKHDRTGKLCEGKFKSSYVNNDRYLKYLYSYIHLNPAKLIDKDWKTRKHRDTGTILKYVYDYPYSSIGEFKNNTAYIINPSPFPMYFKKINEHRKELFGWLEQYKD